VRSHPPAKREPSPFDLDADAVRVWRPQYARRGRGWASTLKAIRPHPLAKRRSGRVVAHRNATTGPSGVRRLASEGGGSGSGGGG
jgi:hypothetical protein